MAVIRRDAGGAFGNKPLRSHNPFKHAALNMMKQVGDEGINSGLQQLRKARSGMNPSMDHQKPPEHVPHESAEKGPKGENSKQPSEEHEQYMDNRRATGHPHDTETSHEELLEDANQHPQVHGEHEYPERDENMIEEHPASPVDRMLASFGKRAPKRVIEVGKGHTGQDGDSHLRATPRHGNDFAGHGRGRKFFDEGGNHNPSQGFNTRATPGRGRAAFDEGGHVPSKANDFTGAGRGRTPFDEGGPGLKKGNTFNRNKRNPPG